ncbi:hypothetical protein EDB85DRAFT_1895706 [Lactarius pseudohatsudake]|nr:hypothetical protein EDB85DRAFT_1895706 [Lactarius pseudohatsudake]
MKRSSDPSLPTPELKYTKHEIPPLSSKKLKHLREDIQGSKTPESTDDVPDFDLGNVYAAAHSAITSLPGDTYLSKLVREDVFKANVQAQREHFFQSLRRVQDSSFDVWSLITHNDPNYEHFSGAFWTKPSCTEFGYEFPTWDTSEESQHQAIENSWMAEFIDQSPLEGLRAHIEASMVDQTRLIGYPPADREVREFLTRNDSDSSALSLIKHFLLVLFIKTKEALGCMGFTKSDRIQEFRSYMLKDQSMQSPGKNRTDFYEGVVAQARQFQKRMKNSSGKPKTAELAQALYGLREVLNSGDKLSSGHCVFLRKGHHKRCIDSKDCVDVFVAFDEAHTLADSFDNIRKHESRFVVLQRILNFLSSEPLFSFFLSTTGKITQFGQPHGQDTSNCINDGELTMPCPYIHLGFDQLMQNQKILNRWTTLEHVISLECVVHMGRPLWGTRYDHGNDEVHLSLLDFAKQKSLCGSLTDEPFTNSQIANHMHVCVGVGSGIKSLCGIASSEPILSEAASVIMSTEHFNLPRALSLVLKGFSINQGDCGELLVASFFTWAHDKVISFKHPRQSLDKITCHFLVNDLFSSLFSESVFASMKLHFLSLSHRKERERFEMCSEKLTCTLITSSNPSLNLNVKNVGFIIVQVKNNSNASRSKEAIIFQKMDPFKCGLLNDSDKVDGRFPIPIICILFSLSSKETTLTLMDYKVASDGAVDIQNNWPLLAQGFSNQ